MAATRSLVLLSIVGVLGAAARDVPANVLSFYNSLKAGGACSNPLETGFRDTDGGPDTFSYCGDHLADFGIVYITGTGGALANMDIDCDGAQAGDGRCGNSDDIQSQTAFKDVVASYGAGIDDLNANVHPFVVFGNDGSAPGWTNFDPQEYGIEPLSLMAVVCGDQLMYGVWGDTNGDDDPDPLVGEASLSLATACFGNSMTGDNGHDTEDVLYIGFTGAGAVPGADGADWAAASFAAFESSIAALGDQLVAKIGSTSGGSTTTTGMGCSWDGHCAGAPCGDENDCSDDLVCKRGLCAA
ncbi:chitosanase precursor [Lasiosphaeria miniovina]|uniref:Endo-chitosanase n=1 Tax=Lasiosphaeria miniovina TaxID=1954250 RepID=A0AA40DVZ6_9PEZI|nr:chitosanase precursor [Lasiosphaeria miniovina]KAK0713733.1 chitosanase precursor [Lasiosphaeria miniovina]